MKVSDKITLQNGIFKAMSQITTPIWGADLTQYLDMYYLYNHSYNKVCSRLLELETIENCAEVVISLFDKSWEKLYNSYIITYDLLNNVNLTETKIGTELLEATGQNNKQATITGNKTVTNTGTETLSATGENNKQTNITEDTTLTNTGTQTNNETNTYNGSVKDVKTQSDSTGYGKTINVNNANNVFGYNSETAVPSDTSTGTQTDGGTDSYLSDVTNDSTIKNTNSKENTMTNNLTNTTDTSKSDITNISTTDNSTKTLNLKDLTEDTKTDTTTVSTVDNNTKTYNLTNLVKGTNGKLTPAEIISDNKKLWTWRFFDTIFKDIDSVLTIPVYEFN